MQADIKAQNCGIHCKANQTSHMEPKYFTNIPKCLFELRII